MHEDRPAEPELLLLQAKRLYELKLFQMPIRAVAVFCGSKSGTNEHYKQDAERLGTLLAEHKLQMIYGGGKNGLMGHVADAVLQAGGTVRGIIPKLLMEQECGHQTISELTVVESMHERKRLMYALCDAAVILPGGFGTLDELFEMLTWNGLSLHDKKIFLINSGGFYNYLLQHLKVLSNEGFLYGALDKQLIVLESASGFQKYLLP
jgi:uncharacterized protein (TIGR00730 family)